MTELVDSFRRTVKYMRVSLTDRCNLRCNYCMPAWGNHWMEKDTLLSYDELIRVIELSAQRGVHKIRLTGGEPLVRKGCVDFVRRVGEVEGITEVAMTTNAILLKEHAQDLYDAGLRHLNISLDSLQEEKFAEITRGNQLKRVWDGIQAAVDVGFPNIKINAVAQRGVNEDEFVDFVKLTEDMKIDMRFIEFMPVSDWENWKKKYISIEDIQKIVTDGVGELIPVYDGDVAAGPAENFRIPGFAGRVGFIHAISNHFCDTCNRIRLTADGKVRPCLFGKIEVDFREAMREGASDEELNDLFDEVLQIKPDAHNITMENPEKMLTSMTAIGG
ncbi:MAG: GTP 3',8-cyclase MoaA [Leptospirillia bacterium]